MLERGSNDNVLLKPCDLEADHFISIPASSNFFTSSQIFCKPFLRRWVELHLRSTLDVKLRSEGFKENPPPVVIDAADDAGGGIEYGF